ncbi:CACTA en-spm transposon protein [Cucumis melo var. makuwa]|uniref:CACTA en-spm transposon protein n=1 Tax=Cucumis melo var. makuwa TaxID=1194695 RepID=A0A5D3DBI6_CUCMM|nr:CACTA en-spm transposon protein [Cucumis melo var. makuwa]
MSKDTISSFSRNFNKIDVMFLKFAKDLDNPAGGSSLVNENSGESNDTYCSTICDFTSGRRGHFRLLELERYVHVNGMILMSINSGVEKLILLHVVRFHQTIDVCVQKKFPVRCLKWMDVGQEHIENFFVLDSNDQPMNSNGSKSFLEQHELAEQIGKLVDHVELFRKTPIRDGTFVLEAAENAHGSQPLSRDKICEIVLGRRPGYSKGLGWGLKSKAYKTTSASSATTSCLQSTVELQLPVELNEAKRVIEEQTKIQDMLALKVERMRKLIENMSRAQQGPPHDP